MMHLNHSVKAMLLVAILGIGPSRLMAEDHGHGAPAHAQILEEITVSARRLAEYIKNHPQQVEVMDRDEIKSRNFLNMEEALGSMSGVDVQPSGTGLGARISIRGSGANERVLILINGRLAGASQYGSAVLADIPLSMVERIEVFKPPVPVWLGPGASAGAINIVLAADKQAGKEVRPSSRAQLLWGSFGTAGMTLSKTFPLDSQRLQLGASGRRTDGRRENSDSANSNVSAQWEMQTESGLRYDANGRYYYSSHGSPGPVHKPTPDADQTYQKGSADLRARGVWGETAAFNAKFFADAVRLEDRSQYGFTSILNTRGIGAEAETDWAEKEGLWAFRTGAKLQHEGVDHTLTGEHDRQKAGLHGQFDRNFNPLSISLGARGDWTSDFGVFPSANLSAAYEWTPKSIIKAGVGYTVNIPTFGQLYQPSHGSIDQVRGNPDLKEEKVVNASLGLTQKLGDAGELTVILFRQDVTDLIAYEDDENGIKRPENIPDAWRQGMEATFKWRITSQTDLDLSYIWQKSRNEANGRKLTYTPAHKLKTVLKQTLETTDTRLEVSLTADSEQYSDMVNSEEKKVDGYLTVALKIVQPLKYGRLPIELFVQINNLFDKDYDVHYGYPDDGFRAYAGLNIEF